MALSGPKPNELCVYKVLHDIKFSMKFPFGRRLAVSVKGPCTREGRATKSQRRYVSLNAIMGSVVGAYLGPIWPR